MPGLIDGGEGKSVSLRVESHASLSDILIRSKAPQNAILESTTALNSMRFHGFEARTSYHVYFFLRDNAGVYMQVSCLAFRAFGLVKEFSVLPLALEFKD